MTDLDPPALRSLTPALTTGAAPAATRAEGASG